MNKTDMKALRKSYDSQRSDTKPAPARNDRELQPATDTRVRLSLSPPSQLHECLDAIAESLGVTKPDVALMAIRHSLPYLLSLAEASDKLRRK